MATKQKKYITSPMFNPTGDDVSDDIKEIIGNRKNLALVNNSMLLYTRDFATSKLRDCVAGVSHACAYGAQLPSDRKDTDLGFVNFLNLLAAACHFNAWNNGWWTKLGTNTPDERNAFEMIALIHSELSEARDACCGESATFDDHLPHRLGVEVELADSVIRIFDTAIPMGINLGVEVKELMIDNHKHSLCIVANQLASELHSTADLRCDIAFSKLQSRCSRFLEAYRKGGNYGQALALVLIGIFELAELLKLDIASALFEKAAYNNSRLDHKPENRNNNDDGKIA